MENGPTVSAAQGLQRAARLDALGRTIEARDAYLDVLRRDPANHDALLALGTLLFNARYRRAARLTYERLLEYYPHDLAGLVNLANLELEAGDAERARQLYAAALAIDDRCARAYQGLSYALARLGDEPAAARHREIGFRLEPVVVAPYRGERAPVTVLVLLSPQVANVATDLFLDDTTFATIKLFPEYIDAKTPLPVHDVVFNAVGDVDKDPGALNAARRVAVASTRPVINAPEAVARTARAAAYARFAGIDGLRVPRVRRLRRDELLDLAWEPPYLLRSPGYHTGEHFELVERIADAAAVAERLPGDELLALEFFDARANDGLARKLRVMFIDGVMYPLHLARATSWKVHYFTADRVDDPDAMEEEALFLSDPRAVLGPRATGALAALRDRMQLDYFGVDFALDADRRVMLFEANATMKIVPAAGDAALTPRGLAAQAALDATRAMVLARAAKGNGREHDAPAAPSV